jgi:hypothetical protein
MDPAAGRGQRDGWLRALSGAARQGRGPLRRRARGRPAHPAGSSTNEILADEIGHVGFIAARLDEYGRSMMRRLYARLSSTLASQFSEIDALFGPLEMARRFSAFHLADAVAELPTLAFAAAQI